MKKIFVLLTVFITSLNLYAQIEFSGFMDFISYTDLEIPASEFSYGQFEIDMAMELTENMYAEAAIAYNADEEKMALGMGFIEYYFYNNKWLPSLSLGQFDVPFGRDYLVLPSTDRPLVTVPLLNRKTIDSWNDSGLNVNGALSLLEYSVFYVNGQGDCFSLGGRANMTLFKTMNFGFSYAGDIGKADIKSDIYGLDFAMEILSSEVIVEYQKASNLLDGIVQKAEHSGYYVQIKTDFKPFTCLPLFTLARFGAWADESDLGSDTANEIVFGAGWNLSENASLRCEFLQEKKNDVIAVNTLIVQTVISF